MVAAFTMSSPHDQDLTKIVVAVLGNEGFSGQRLGGRLTCAFAVRKTPAAPAARIAKATGSGRELSQCALHDAPPQRVNTAASLGRSRRDEANRPATVSRDGMD
jgi:hypothetical protein